MSQTSSASPSPGYASTRRGFLKKSVVLAAAGSIAGPSVLSSRSADTPQGRDLKIGLIGCGGRGTGAAAQALAADSHAVLTAMGDAFDDKLQGSLQVLKAQFGPRIKVDPDHCFTGFDAYQKVIASGVDVVLLASPPGFRPLHIQAAVEAGKHIFSEKPMAVDAPGVRSVLASAEIARQKKLSLVAGFCWRYHPAVSELYQRILDGGVGDIRSIYATYNAGGRAQPPSRLPGESEMRYQVRNWYFYTWLSGDHLVEQAVHSVDKIAWAMRDQPPLNCLSLGGRQVRTAPEYGHIFDHFSVMYEYPQDARAFVFARQQNHCDQDNSDHITGTKGVAEKNGFRKLFAIRGEKNWRYTGRSELNMYQVEHDKLFNSIRTGKPINDGTWMAHSTLLAIMGRMSAYTGKVITWEDALNSKESLMPRRLDWDEPIAIPPVAMPGITPFS